MLAVVHASPAGAQGTPDSPPEIVIDSSTFGGSQPDSSGFGAFMAIALVIGIGGAIFKFVTVRDMGIRRGLSERDATAAALFSDDEVTSTMILKPESTASTRPTSPIRRQQEREPEPSIEDRLAKVESLRERGIITEAEATERRDEILDEI